MAAPGGGPSPRRHGCDISFAVSRVFQSVMQTHESLETRQRNGLNGITPRQIWAATRAFAMKPRGRKTTKLNRRKPPDAARARPSSTADVQQQLERRTRELAQAREQH